jgi:transcriptional regulator with XRE-family HTH domain
MALGITQHDLADKLNITLLQMSSIEQNKHSPSLKLFIRITEQLDASMDYLVLGKTIHIDAIAAINAEGIMDETAKKSLINLIMVMRDTKSKEIQKQKLRLN